MATSADKLHAVINGFLGGSENRYRHHFNRAFIFTEGMKAVADEAGAYWLIDEMALVLAPVYAKAWLAEAASIGIVDFHVTEAGVGRLTLSLADDQPPAVDKTIDQTDFPPGQWQFYFGTDQAGPDQYVTTCLVPPEY